MHKKKKVFLTEIGMKIALYHGVGDVDKVAYDVVVNNNSITNELETYYNQVSVRSGLAKEIHEQLLPVHKHYSKEISDMYFEKFIGVLLSIFPEGKVITEALYFDYEEEEFYPLGCRFIEREYYRKVD